MMWSPDGGLVAVRCPSNRPIPCEILTLNSDGTGATSLHAPTGPDGAILYDLSISPDGSEVAYSTDGPGGVRGGFEVIVAKLDGSGSRDLGEGQSPDISPDGSAIAFSSDTGEPGCQSRREVFTMNAADGSNRRNLSQLPCSTGTSAPLGQNYSEDHPEWSPDGRWIAFRPPNEDVELISGDGSERRELFRPSAWGNTVSWSPAPGPAGPSR
jgi:Tol biopolymer transport system component